jgi:hypothetical protein
MLSTGKPLSDQDRRLEPSTMMPSGESDSSSMP